MRLPEFSRLLGRERSYLEEFITLNKVFSRSNVETKELLSFYERAISAKFSRLYSDLLVSRMKTTRDSAISNWIKDFHVRYLDFKLDCYIRNLDTIREIFFGMKDTLYYCARLQLSFAYQFSQKRGRENQGFDETLCGKGS